jgi:hypothetical protein
MPNFSVLDFDSAEIILEISASAHIKRTIEEIICFLQTDSRTAVFEINGVIFNLKNDSNVHNVHSDYLSNQRGFTSGIVGPYPPVEPSLDTNQAKDCEYLFDG